MKKLYTTDHKHICTCNEFEKKNQDYLDYLMLHNPTLCNAFNTDLDFRIANFKKFQSNFNIFFNSWLRNKFSFKLKYCEKNITNFFENIRTTVENYEELFALYNLYKKINSSAKTIYFYDISLDEDNRYKLILQNKGKDIVTI